MSKKEYVEVTLEDCKEPMPLIAYSSPVYSVCVRVGGKPYTLLRKRDAQTFSIEEMVYENRTKKPLGKITGFSRLDKGDVAIHVGSVSFSLEADALTTCLN